MPSTSAGLFLLTADCSSGFPPGNRDSRGLRLHRRPNHPLDGHPAWTAPRISPLIIRITCSTIAAAAVYPGDLDNCNSLLRHLRRLSATLIDGIPPPVTGRSAGAEQRSQTAVAPARYRILRPEDEAGSRTPVPTVENRRQSRSEEFHGREVVRGRTAAHSVSNPRLSWPPCCFLAAVAFLARDVWLGALGRALIHDDGASKAEICRGAGPATTGKPADHRGGLVKQGYVPRVLVSGPPDSTRSNEADAAIQFGIRKGYPPVVRPPVSTAHSTREEAVFVLDALTQRNIHSFLLVTGNYHTARARRIFLSAERQRGGGPDLRWLPRATGTSAPPPVAQSRRPENCIYGVDPRP